MSYYPLVCAMHHRNLTNFYEVLYWGAKLMNVARRVLFRFVSALDTQGSQNLAYHIKMDGNFNDN
jgi:hypothetical protein